jgi:hypothetical protein
MTLNEKDQARLLSAAARALERVQVEDSGEAEHILSQVVELDGTYIPHVDNQGYEIHDA